MSSIRIPWTKNTTYTCIKFPHANPLMCFPSWWEITKKFGSEVKKIKTIKTNIYKHYLNHSAMKLVFMVH
jgi:hypothetical protein